MNSRFYSKLALSNIKKNRKSYVPYILTCVITVMMFYIMNALAGNEGLDKMPGADALKSIMNMSTFVIAIFACIFLFYTNSFLIKQRKKELGLYNVLGMGKRHIAKMMVWEVLYVAGVSIVFGLVFGMIFNKLMFLLLLKILNFSVPLQSVLSTRGIILTLVLFTAIFVVSLLFNLFQIKVTNPIDLLSGGAHGEKEPKSRWLYGLFGVITIGIGYGMALTLESPIQAVGMFFVAVILVIMGTYGLFIAGSIILLKLLRKNKSYYYKANHFVAVSSMIYRMKQNAVGLANICILSTVVLVMLSTSVSLYVGVEDVLKNRYPSEYMYNFRAISSEKKEVVKQIVSDQAKEKGVELEGLIQCGEAMTFVNDKTGKLSLEVNKSQVYSDNNIASLVLLTLQEYNVMEEKSVTLDEREVLLYTTQEKMANFDEINLDSMSFEVKEELKTFRLAEKDREAIVNSYYVIVPDVKTYEALVKLLEERELLTNEMFYSYFDIKGSELAKTQFLQGIEEKFNQGELSYYKEIREESRTGFYALYGGLLFIGIFLGGLFLMATVLIIYYKQISEGLEDRQRFVIMQKVGMGQKEVRRSIKSQVITVFFLPLVTAIIHIAVAFKVICMLLKVLYLTNTPLFLNCTIITVIIFALFYGIVFCLTAKQYYKIVKA